MFPHLDIGWMTHRPLLCLMCGMPRHVLSNRPRRIQPLQAGSQRQVPKDRIRGLLRCGSRPRAGLYLASPQKLQYSKSTSSFQYNMQPFLYA
ncbi:UNVERIFIED_CONTAM: hypothetical protein Sradi_0010800 [Sesamum radiatum]|uniref:Uncharacterized protein n=1 Tax=Sesamum radiatum TaxID=300843 RepID=A0AAW2WFY1_SESRA